MPFTGVSPAGAPALLRYATDPVIGTAELNFCQRKSVGTLLGLMVGDVLGAAVENNTAEQVCKYAPAGLTDFQQTERG